MAFGICSLSFWLYFQAGVKWTADPVVPQIEGVLALVGQSTAALIFVPAGILALKRSHRGLLIAVVWPMIYAVSAFLLPNIFAWLFAAIVLLATGLLLLRSSA